MASGWRGGRRTERDADELGHRLQGLLDGLVGRKGIRHAVMAVERADGSFRWAGAAGAATPDGARMRPGTPFHLASVSKLYTATVVMQLVEDGSVGLDEPISAYLPKSLVAGLHRLDGRDHTAAITVRHLLGHTSGLPDYFLAAPAGATSYDDRLIAGDFSYAVDDVVERVRALTPHFPPQDPAARRQRAHYSDTNYVLLGALVGAAAGREFEQVVEERVLVPLGLADTWFAGLARTEEPAVVSTIWSGDIALERPRAMRSMGPEGGLVGTADDALAFLRALAAGKPFARRGTLAEMQRRFNRFDFPRSRSSMAAPGWPIAYGLGIKRLRIGRLLAPGRRPATLYGHSGASGSWLFRCPELGCSVAGTVDQTAAAAVPYRLTPKVLHACSG